MTDDSKGSPKVLLVGFDPRLVTGVDAELVETAIAIGQARLDEFGIVADMCLFGPDEDPNAAVASALQGDDYACVVIGGGVRKPDDTVEVLESVVNAIRLHAPGASIPFNTTPTDSADAARRWLPAH